MHALFSCTYAFACVHVYKIVIGAELSHVMRLIGHDKRDLKHYEGLGLVNNLSVGMCLQTMCSVHS
jgi:hypothetical protein